MDHAATYVKCLVDNVLATKILLVELAHDVKLDTTVFLTAEVSGTFWFQRYCRCYCCLFAIMSELSILKSLNHLHG